MPLFYGSVSVLGRELVAVLAVGLGSTPSCRGLPGRQYLLPNVGVVLKKLLTNTGEGCDCLGGSFPFGVVGQSLVRLGYSKDCRRLRATSRIRHATTARGRYELSRRHRMM